MPSVHFRNESTPLHSAVDGRHKDIVDLLLRRRADINVQHPDVKQHQFSFYFS
jgi:ankyrin repeat protein